MRADRPRLSGRRLDSELNEAAEPVGWRRFNAGAVEQRWYYGELLAVFEARDAGPLVAEFRRAVEALECETAA